MEPLSLTLGGEDFPLERRIVTAGGISLPLACVPYSSAQLDRIVRIRGLAERAWPYWLEEWPVTYALADLLGGEEFSPGEPALDLGCGAGFLACFLRRRHGLRVFACDFNPDACRLTALNLRLQESESPREHGWPRAGVVCADLSAFPMRGRFSLVLAGDLLYAQANHEPMLAFLAGHLSARGRAYLADPGRSAAAGFAERAEQAGFRVDFLVPPDRSGKARIYRVARNTQGPE